MEELDIRRSPSLPQVELRRAHASRACYHTHAHDEFSFGVIDAGAARYRNGRHDYRVGRGSLVTINPGDAHSCNPDAGRWSYRMLFVDSRWLGGLQRELFGGAQDFRPFAGPLDDSGLGYRPFDRLFALLARGREPLAAETALLDFLMPRFGPLPEPALDIPALRRVGECIRDQLAEPLTLGELSELADLSRYQLIRGFKQYYGLSPHAYQLDRRIDKAKGLLRRGLALSRVASELGFADQAHFQRHFKRRLALTPGQYQGFFRHPAPDGDTPPR